MGIAPVQPDRPALAAACGDYLRTALADGGDFVLCTYVPASEARLPDSAVGRIPVRAEIVLRGAGMEDVGSAGQRIGAGGLSARMASVQASPLGTRTNRSVRVGLARLAPVAAGAPQVDAINGVVDPGDGYGGRVVRLGKGDRLVVPASEIYGPQEAESDVVILIGGVSSDGSSWLAEGQL